MMIHLVVDTEDEDNQKPKAIFSDPDRAEYYRKHKSPYLKIVEMVLNAEADKILRRWYQAFINVQTGEVKPDNVNGDTLESPDIDYDFHTRNWHGFEIVVRSFISLDHAMEICKVERKNWLKRTLEEDSSACVVKETQ